MNLFTCNNKESDTRMVLHALKSEGDVVITFKDTDVLILLCYVYAKEKVNHNWVLKFDKEKYGEIIPH